MVSELEKKVSAIGDILQDPRKPLKQRFRALFTLRNIGGEKSIACIGDCFKDSSALLKHELAYCLGQMGDKRALPILIDILRDTSQEPMVRHEAGEALGAIGCESCIDVLQEYTNDPMQEVAETCELALQRIEWNKTNGHHNASPFLSVDPTPASEVKNIDELKTILLNEQLPLFDRYKAMFSLRNLNTNESVSSLCKGLFAGSALFRHEVAFVLGQLQNETSTPHLISALKDTSQNEMVRHECAEALGVIASQQCVETLRQYLNDSSRVVRESCEIALDMADYEMSEEFQYANTASMVGT